YVPNALHMGPQPAVGILLALMVLTMIPNLIAEYAAGAAFDGDWRPAVRYVDSNFRDGDALLVPASYQPRIAAYTDLSSDAVTLLAGKDRVLIERNEQIESLTGKHWVSVSATPAGLEKWLQQSGHAARWWVLCAAPGQCAEDDYFLKHVEAHTERL